MDRKHFLKTLAILPLAGMSMKLEELNKLTGTFGKTEKMPVLFVGHGNPMNAITDNIYSKTWKAMGEKLTTPKAILCVSAHWLTNGTAVTMVDHPKTIHDFGGFPEELFAVQYPAPGAVDYAKMAIDSVTSTVVHEDFEWGLDHGAWSVLKNMYPKANIPVFQMSIDYAKPPQYHFNLAKELYALRSKGVMIVASGNVVHNLGLISWDGKIKAYDWAVEFDTLVKKSIEDNNPTPLIEYQKLGKIATLAHPTNDHYLPLMYTLGLRDKTDQFQFFNDTLDMGSLSMRSVLFS
ncbi:MAG: dioxygenase extradiol [Bacteroidetes bacterium]|jgi:4,5-DOPA dioxygenase extradiol|nr:dioxygenase extradiol [Bacteroidota bacterium]MDF2453282.1 dioxygenase extradiol [Bacteroidota bacterium]